MVETKQGEVLISEGSEVRLKIINELTGETSTVQGEIKKMAAKKMEVLADNIDFVIVVEYGSVSEIEVL